MAGINHIYQIWIEDPDPPSETLKSYMLSYIGKGLPYRLFSTSNYFEDDPRVEWIDVNTIIQEILFIYCFIEKPFNLMTPQTKSDVIRAYLATKYPDGLYADCDMELLIWPTLSTSYSYFGRESELIDDAVFADNGDAQIMSSWLHTILIYLIHIDYTLPFNQIFKMINSFKIGKDYSVFDASCFKHNRSVL